MFWKVSGDHVDKFDVPKTRGFRFFPGLVSKNQVAPLQGLLKKEEKATFQMFHDLTRSKKTQRISGLDLPLPSQITAVLENFCDDFYNTKQTITRVSMQYLIALEEAPGQAYHLDSWQKYLTMVIYLTPSLSTIFMDVDYVDVSLDGNVGYPSEWPHNVNSRYTVVNPGDVTIFWSNTPHAAPPNLVKDVRKVLYVAYTVTPGKVSEFTKFIALSDLESPVFFKQYHAGKFISYLSCRTYS